ncbi:hypothetical protein GWI33_017161 [Rhynchophorus ferrugineus]|uniref:Uncharacterized protein n=1 Tax=Rhynchophorus ferrugineus TaxID=354439 RepID=A0A834M9I6_RHYFE|nr:hypothetical protein GWI33_017161 [Rhynchophorus ferrugineus]
MKDYDTGRDTPSAPNRRPVGTRQDSQDTARGRWHSRHPAGVQASPADAVFGRVSCVTPHDATATHVKITVPQVCQPPSPPNETDRKATGVDMVVLTRAARTGVSSFAHSDGTQQSNPSTGDLERKRIDRLGISL